jgi:hypothetical protein
VFLKNKIGKPLAKLNKDKREKAQVHKTRNERGDITTDTTEIKRITREYYQQMYTNKVITQKIHE